MSQIKPYLAVVILSFGLLLNGCGDTNSQVAHQPGWTHQTVAKSNIDSCASCHGQDFKGGISKVACTSCHLGSQQAVHPEQWDIYAYARHSGYVAQNGTTKCANAACHGANLAGVAGSGTSCTTCHLGGTTSKHPVDWTTLTGHKTYVNANGTTGCATAVCHGVDLKGAFFSGQSCDSCHIGGTLAVHPVTANWTVDHRGYTLTGLNLTQTRQKCDNSACHGSFSDATKPGFIKIPKTAAACQACHAGDKN